ncbi:MAG: galactose-1-phosphate uridylyltransferase [Actinomycetota bacterium]
MAELRFDPYTREWVNVVGHRQDRPHLPAATDGCPFCPGGLEAPADYDVRWFPNRWPAFAPGDAVDLAAAQTARTRSVPAAGASEVVLFAPQHDASLSTLPVEQVRRVVDVWAARTVALLAHPEVEYVLVFENRGREAGATVDHPHGQIYGYSFIPPVPANEAAIAREHGCAVCSELEGELADGRRIVAERPAWVAYVPYAAAYPYGLRLASRTHIDSLAALDDASRDDLSALLVDVLGRYDALWSTPLPYLLWFHQAAAAGGDEWHVHAHTAPPLRAPGLARYVASGELGSGVLQNPVEPETAARQLREV